MVKENVPQKTAKKRWDVPYITPEIKKLIRKKKRVYNTLKANDTVENRQKFSDLRKTVQKSCGMPKTSILWVF